MYKWKGIDLRTKGIIVSKTPSIPKAQKKITTYEIDGRNGFLSIDSGVYKPFALSLECHIDTSKTSIDSVKEFLDGYGTLSLDGEREYTAIINNSIPFDKIAYFREFIIQFLVNPISEDVTPTNVSINSNPKTINITDATAEMFPILTIRGSGNVSITINDKIFYLYDLDSTKTYTLDSKLKTIIDDQNNNCSDKMLNEFPTLIPGNNTISYVGTISQFTISYKKAYL